MDAAHFAADLLDKIGVAVGGSGPADIHIHDDRFYKRVIRDRELGLGEAYQEGWWTANGLDEFLAVAQETNLADHVKPSPALLKLALQSRFGNRQDAKKAKKNAQAHYDIGNDLFERMLDKRMIYTCAYWRDAENLDAAQEAKLDLICRKLRLEPGMRLLDIGCGWGGMAIYLAQKFQVRVTAITLSREQLALAQERAEAAGVADRISFELVDYRELPGRGKQFDRIVSVGMFEHVGRPQFETFFEACANLLVDDGVMLVHTIGRIGSPGTTDAFTRKYVFPGGYIPALSETVAASEKFRLIATDTEMLRLHYGKTLRQWYANCLAHREEIIALHDERFYRMWMFYLVGATSSFEYGGMCNYQIQKSLKSYHKKKVFSSSTKKINRKSKN